MIATGDKDDNGALTVGQKWEKFGIRYLAYAYLVWKMRQSTTASSPFFSPVKKVLHPRMVLYSFRCYEAFQTIVYSTITKSCSLRIELGSMIDIGVHTSAPSYIEKTSDLLMNDLCYLAIGPDGPDGAHKTRRLYHKDLGIQLEYNGRYAYIIMMRQRIRTNRTSTHNIELNRQLTINDYQPEVVSDSEDENNIDDASRSEDAVAVHEGRRFNWESLVYRVWSIHGDNVFSAPLESSSANDGQDFTLDDVRSLLYETMKHQFALYNKVKNKFIKIIK
jgi:hypothetical protein